MLTLSKQALDKLQATFKAQEKGKGFLGVRVAVEGGGCSGFQYSMNLERTRREGDHVIDVNGFQVFVDQQSMLYLEGTRIDYVENLQGQGFKFENPNATSSCGCGESFKV